MPRSTPVWFFAMLTACGGATVDAPRSVSPSPAPSAALPAAPAKDDAPPTRDDGRLPPGVRPVRYALDLAIDPSKPTFTGHTRITIAIDKPTRAIVLHGRGLTIRTATLTTSRGKLAGTARLRLAFESKEPEELVVSFDEEAPAGAGELDFTYEAPFAQGLVGLYRVDEKGAPYAFTQFESNDARRAFPCFDEPGFKTPFALRIDVPKGSTAVANMPDWRHEDRGDFVTFVFPPSPPLPTYLVAFAVGPLEVREGATYPVPVRVVTTKGKTSLGDLALEASEKHLDLLARYFDRPYPYAKLDVLAVPNFAYGAMENAGLVTFREDYLLAVSNEVSIGGRRLVSEAVAHELAHQWFGDLVTMQWWDDLWLNESFASWIGDKVVDQWQPGSHARLRALSDKTRAMGEDSLSSAPKIRNPIRSTNDLGALNAAIIYDKGKAVLSMVERWLGEEPFRDGIRRYLKKYAWGNVTARDLYGSLGEASQGRNVTEVMETFTDQSGVPFVSAELTCPKGAAPSLRLRQREYLTLDRTSSNAKLWKVPVCAAYEAGGKMRSACKVLGSAEDVMELPASGGPAACPSFVYANQDEAGYYRLALARSDLDRLTSLTALAKLGEPERFGIVSNAAAEVWSGDLAASAFLGMLPRFKKETSLLVWQMIFDALRDAHEALISDAGRPAFAKLVRDLVGPTARRLGWTSRPNESEDERLLRASALRVLGRLGDDPDTIARSQRVAEAWLADPSSTDTDVGVSAMIIAAKRGDSAFFDRLVASLKTTQSPDSRRMVLHGLASFDDPALVRRALDLMLDGTIKQQDLHYYLHKLATRRAIVDVVATWLQSKLDDFAKVAPQFVLSDVPEVAATLCNAERTHAFESFVGPRLKSVEGIEQNLKKSVEEGLRCSALAEKERSATEKWLAAPQRQGGT
jgi:alanyl aminopeptidase